MKSIKKLWIARDENGALFLYDEKPHLKEENPFLSVGVKYKEWIGGRFFCIDDNLFSEVTFENSPKEILMIL